MHGSRARWSVGALVIGLALAGSTSAWGQQDVFSMTDPGYAPYGPYQVASGNTYFTGESGDLAGRVADLEAELEKMKDKAAAAKKKAAGRPSVKVGGRIQLDWALFGQGAASINNYGDWQDGVEFRRVRLYAAGEAFNVIDYKLQMDFADTDKANQGWDPGPPEPDHIDALIQSTAFKAGSI